MAKSGVSLELGNDKALLRALKKLGKESRQRTVIRRALSAATTPVNRAAKRRAPEATGQYRKSIGKKTVTYKDSGTVVVVIGPRRGFKVIGEDGRAHDPALIGHLLEFGHGGPRPARPHPHLRPAYDETRAEAQKIFNEKAWEGVRKEARRVAAKGRGR